MSSKYDIVFSFDTTGSMSACINQVKKNLKSLVERLFRDIKDIRIGIIAHGDYCDENTTYLMKHIDLTNDVEKIINFVTNVTSTCGGDYPEAYEYVLREVQKFSWSANKMRSLVMIGDAYPHSVETSKYKIDWRHEVDELNKMNINIYSVQALNSGRGESYTFYKQMALKTNGYHLFLDQFMYITDMFIAICYNQVSQEKVEEYEQEMKTKLGGLTKSMRVFFDSILKRKSDLEEVEKEIEKYNPDDDKIMPCPPAKYQLMLVDNDITIKQYVVNNGLTYKTGKGFYQFTKPEIIQPKKAIILRKKDTWELFEGKKARYIAKLNSSVNKRFRPTDLPDYDVFIQSTSYTRKLVKNTYFLYQANDWVDK